MTNADRYSIGTPDMQRKQREVDERVDRIVHHPCTKPALFAVFALILGSLYVAALLTAREEMAAERAAQEEAALAERAARERAHQQLKIACADKGGSLVPLGMNSPVLCLADEMVIFNLPDMTGEGAQAITGLSDPSVSQQPQP